MADDKNNVKYNTQGLDDIITMLKKDYSVKVGILGSQAKATHDGKSKLTNAEIGTFHEFGTENVPKRSFLWDSLIEQLDFNKQKTQLLKKSLFHNFFNKQKPKELLLDLATAALAAIEMGFATNGFGRWKKLADATVNRRARKLKSRKKREQFKHYHNILTDTGKLRHSIKFKIEERK